MYIFNRCSWANSGVAQYISLTPFHWWPVTCACQMVNTAFIHGIPKLFCMIYQDEDHSHRKRYRKFQISKKQGCPAKIFIKEVVSFPLFEVSNIHATVKCTLFQLIIATINLCIFTVLVSVYCKRRRRQVVSVKVIR